jgi:hypothetical protein
MDLAATFREIEMSQEPFLQRRVLGRLTGAELLARVLWLPVFIVIAMLAVFFFAVFATLLFFWLLFILFRLWRARRAWLKAQNQKPRTGPLDAEYRVITERETITRRKG